MNNSFKIVNLSHENKLIYIGHFLHPLKGVLITPIGPERSICPTNRPGDKIFRTFPIIGEDWQVIDDSWASLEIDYGFDNRILGRVGDTIPLCNKALIEALEELPDCSAAHPIDLLKDAERMGVTFTDEGYGKLINLNVSKGFIEGTYSIGNTSEIFDDLEMDITCHTYPVADHLFRLDIKESIHEKSTKVYDPGLLVFALKRAISAYADFFQRTGIRVNVNFDKDIPKSDRKKIRKFIHQLNAYMEFIDEINQYESQTSKTDR